MRDRKAKNLVSFESYEFRREATKAGSANLCSGVVDDRKECQQFEKFRPGD